MEKEKMTKKRKRVTQKGIFFVTLDSKILMYDKYTAVFSSSQALEFLFFEHPPACQQFFQTGHHF